VRERIEYRFRVPSATIFPLYSYSKVLEYHFRVTTAGSLSSKCYTISKNIQYKGSWCSNTLRVHLVGIHDSHVSDLDSFKKYFGWWIRITSWDCLAGKLDSDSLLIRTQPENLWNNHDDFCSKYNENQTLSRAWRSVGLCASSATRMDVVRSNSFWSYGWYTCCYIYCRGHKRDGHEK
jgi:hypothetical protein